MSKYSDVHEACYNGHLAMVKSIFEKEDAKEIFNSRYGYDGRTVLHDACRGNNPEVLEFLITTLENGCDDGKWSGHFVENILNATTHSLVGENRMDYTALHIAIGLNTAKCTHLLLDNPRTSVLMGDGSDNHTILHIACIRKDEKCVIELLAHPRCKDIINVQTVHGLTALLLSLSSEYGTEEILELLLNYPYTDMTIRIPKRYFLKNP